MKTDKATVFDLFEKQRRYLVPLFQRGYVWQKATQWEPLWQDILDQANTLRSNSKSANQYHFLGAIVLNQVTTMIRQTAASEIIDGQQRLLTLQILLIALRDAAAIVGSEYTQATLERLTTNPGPYRDPDEAYKVWPTNAYRHDLHTVKNAKVPTALEKQFPQKLRYKKLVPPRPPLVDAYLYFASAITTDITSTENRDRQAEALDELTQVITRNLQLVSIELDTDDDAQVIFETLNARGVPLEPADLIRNFIFLYATRHEEDPDALYEPYWKDFDEKATNGGTFWKERERQGRLTRTRLDSFFFHYVTYQTVTDINASHLFNAFRQWWNKPPQPLNGATVRRSTSIELERIRTASEHYRALIQPNGDDRFALFARRLKALDTTTIYPLILWFREHEQKLPAEEFDGILQDLESYLVRRMIAGLTTKGYNRTFLSILNNLKSQGVPSRQALQAQLAGLAGDTGLWPEDQSVTAHLISEPIYKSLNQAKVRVLLEGIERGQRTTKQEHLPVPEFLSIEHILPRADDTTAWPFPDHSSSDHLWIRENIKHTIGNLTLVTQPLNSSLSCGPFKNKRPVITANSLLTLNAYFQRYNDNDAWDEDTIKQRSHELARIFLRVWPHPNTRLPN